MSERGAAIARGKAEHEFFDPGALPWTAAPGFGAGVWQQVIAGGADEGVTTRFLRFEAGSGNDRAVTHDFWEEIYVVAGELDCGGTLYAQGCVAVRPPGMPHGPFHSAAGAVLFEVRYRAAS